MRMSVECAKRHIVGQSEQKGEYTGLELNKNTIPEGGLQNESAERDPSARETLKTQQVQRECVVETQGVFYCHYVTNVTIYL
jgi:hypothetical protein